MIRTTAPLLSFCLLLGALHAEESVTLPMSSYQDLLRRLEVLEAKVNGDAPPSAALQKSQTAPIPSAPEGKGMEVILEEELDTGGLFFNYEHVYVKPVYGSNAAFFIHDTEINGAPESADQVEFPYGLESSSRYELGYLLPSSNLGWRARYWSYGTDSTQASPADVDVKIGVADDPDIAIDTISATTADILVATASSDLDVLDFEGISLHQHRNRQTTLGAGVRYAEVHHNYFGEDIDLATGILDANGSGLLADSKFQGAGPTFSVVTRRQFRDSNFGVDFGGRGSLLFGSGDTTLLRLTTPDPATMTGPVGDALRLENNLRIMPVVETRFGLDYSRDFGQGIFTMGTGFEGQFWMNGGVPLIGGQDGATDSDRAQNFFSENMGFLGLYFRAGLTY
ncbi:MAG: Lpg1974 family pore-forming outer membrane protein [Verrucomicrobiota bacterium]